MQLLTAIFLNYSHFKSLKEISFSMDCKYLTSVQLKKSKFKASNLVFLIVIWFVWWLPDTKYSSFEYNSFQ